MLDAGIDVISTVNIQHLESLNDAIFELTERPGARDVPRPRARRRRRGRARRPHARGAAGAAARRQGLLAPTASTSALRQLLPRRQPLRAARARAARGGRGRRGAAARRPCSTRSAQQAVAERVLALVTPEPRSQRILRRAWRSARAARAPSSTRSGCASPGARADARRSRSQLAALRRLAIILGAHFLEEEGDDLVATVRRVVARARLDLRASSARPTRAAAARSSRGSLVSALVRELPGRRHPRRREPRRRGSEPSDRDRDRCRARPRLAVARRRGAGRTPARPGARILVPFSGALDPTVLDAAIRIARAEDAVLVPAYLLVVPLAVRRGLAAAGAGRGRAAAARGGRARRTPRRRAGRRADREGPVADPRAAAAVGGRALRPDRRARRSGFTREGPGVDPHARADRDDRAPPGLRRRVAA